ncbi:MAG: hypothetical protein BWY75_02243 [bacterium ADurb.Bin425]|jgi:hypothetical protein|nr:MAG: hypothetical protein BWY75_02243 [bacterium ADurb.Bin425]
MKGRFPGAEPNLSELIANVTLQSLLFPDESTNLRIGATLLDSPQKSFDSKAQTEGSGSLLGLACPVENEAKPKPRKRQYHQNCLKMNISMQLQKPIS